MHGVTCGRCGGYGTFVEFLPETGWFEAPCPACTGEAASGVPVDEVPGVPRAPRVTAPDTSSSQAGLSSFEHLTSAPAGTVAPRDDR